MNQFNFDFSQSEIASNNDVDNESSGAELFENAFMPGSFVKEFLPELMMQNEMMDQKILSSEAPVMEGVFDDGLKFEVEDSRKVKTLPCKLDKLPLAVTNNPSLHESYYTSLKRFDAQGVSMDPEPTGVFKKTPDCQNEEENKSEVNEDSQYGGSSKEEDITIGKCSRRGSNDDHPTEATNKRFGRKQDKGNALFGLTFKYPFCTLSDPLIF